MNRSTLTFAAALIGLATPAFAADVAGDTGTTATLPARTFVGGSFDFEGDSDWFRVDLKAGRNYAIGDTLPAHTTLSLTLRDAAGVAVVGPDREGAPGGSASSGGFEFAVPTDGIYYVDIRDGGSPAYPTAYSLLLDAADCRGDHTSSCTIGAGQTIVGTLAWWEDVDYLWFRARQGLTYQLRADACEPVELDVYGRSGDIKAVSSPGASGASLAWRAPQSRWYALRVIGTDATEQGTPYDLSVSQGTRAKPPSHVSGCQVAVMKTRR